MSMGKDTSAPDYRAIEIPEDKPPEELSHHERRAEILQEFEDVGYVRDHELAARFEVSKATIRNDLRAIEEAVNQ